MDGMKYAWIQLKRLVGISPATPLVNQSGQIRYVRVDGTDGSLYLAYDKADNSLEWEQLNAKVPLSGGSLTGNLTFQSNKGIISRGTSPTIAAGAALGTGGSLAVAIEGTDRVGKIALTSGALGLGTGVLARISFNTALADANFQVLIGNADSDASRILAEVDYSTLTTTYWEISATVAPILNTSHHWWFMVTPYQP